MPCHITGNASHRLRCLWSCWHLTRLQLKVGLLACLAINVLFQRSWYSQLLQALHVSALHYTCCRCGCRCGIRACGGWCIAWQQGCGCIHLERLNTDQPQLSCQIPVSNQRSCCIQARAEVCRQLAKACTSAQAAMMIIFACIMISSSSAATSPASHTLMPCDAGAASHTRLQRCS